MRPGETGQGLHHLARLRAGVWTFQLQATLESWRRKRPFEWHVDVHAMYTPNANLAHLAHLRDCRVNKLLIPKKL